MRLSILGGRRTLYRGGIDSGSVCYQVQIYVFFLVFILWVFSYRQQTRVTLSRV